MIFCHSGLFFFLRGTSKYLLLDIPPNTSPKNPNCLTANIYRSKNSHGHSKFMSNEWKIILNYLFWYKEKLILQHLSKSTQTDGHSNL